MKSATSLSSLSMSFCAFFMMALVMTSESNVDLRKSYASGVGTGTEMERSNLMYEDLRCFSSRFSMIASSPIGCGSAAGAGASIGVFSPGMSPTAVLPVIGSMRSVSSPGTPISTMNSLISLMKMLLPLSKKTLPSFDSVTNSAWPSRSPLIHWKTLPLNLSWLMAILCTLSGRGAQHDGCGRTAGLIDHQDVRILAVREHVELATVGY